MAFERKYRSVSDRDVVRIGRAKLELVVDPQSERDPLEVPLPPAPRPLADVLTTVDQQHLVFDLTQWVEARQARRAAVMAQIRRSRAIPPIVA